MSIGVTPTNEHPLPDDLSDEFATTFQENARVAANTASLLSELGMPFEMTAEDEKVAQDLFKSVDVKQTAKNPAAANPPSLYTGNVAIKLSALLSEYDHQVVMDAAQARTYITNRLLEISTCGDPKHELRAIELLGKMSDIGAFNEKSEITITHRTSDDLKKSIQEKIERLLHASTIDVTPCNIEDELGVSDKDRTLRLEEELSSNAAPE
jgi:hypothetical protein